MKTTALSMALLALLLAAPLTSHADDDRGKLMDLSFEDTDVKTVIVRIAELSGQNVITSPKVKGRVTVKLSGTPWRAALEQVAGAVGAVVLEEDFGILRIIPAAERPAPWMLSRAKASDVLQIYAVRDLMKAGVNVLEESKSIASRASEFGYTNGTVRLRAQPAVQKRYARHLEKLRKRVAATAGFPRDTSKAPVVAGTLEESGVTFYEKLDPAVARQLELAQKRVAELQAKLARANVEKRAKDVAALTVEADRVRAEMTALSARAAAARAARDRAETDSVDLLRGGAGGEAKKPAVHRTTITKHGEVWVELTMDRDGRLIEKKVLKHDPRTGAIVLKGGDVIRVSPPKAPRAVPLLRGVPLIGGAGGAQKRAEADKQIAAQRKKIESFAAALKHLQAAGAQEEVRRLQARMAEAQAALDRAKQARAQAQAEADRLRVRYMTKSKKTAPFTFGVTTDKQGLQDSIQALRKDVNALRGEVRELTGLVRQMLRRGGAGGRAGQPGQPGR